MTETTSRALRRSSTDRIVGGVAGGVARYLGVDPIIVRIVIALSMFVGGIGFVAYVLAWILMPVDEEADGSTAGMGVSNAMADAPRIVGAILVFVAAAHVLSNSWWAGDLVLPTALVAVGAWLIFRPEREHDPDDGRIPGDVSSPGPPPPPRASPSAAPPPPPVPPPTKTDRGFPTARATAGLVALTAGGLWLARASGADISLKTVLIACLAVCGVGLVVGAFIGGARPLIWLAAPVVLVLIAASSIDVPLKGGIGERMHTPVAVSELEDEYRLGVGELTLDLRGLDTDALDGRTRIGVSVGIGSLQVLLPPDVTVTGTAGTQLGDVEIRGRSESGSGVVQRIDFRGDEGAGVLELDLRVGIGEVQIP